jgi:hypothetical protein
MRRSVMSDIPSYYPTRDGLAGWTGTWGGPDVA